MKHPEWWRRGKVYWYGLKWWTSRINTSGAYEATVGNASLPALQLIWISFAITLVMKFSQITFCQKEKRKKPAVIMEVRRPFSNCCAVIFPVYSFVLHSGLIWLALFQRLEKKRSYILYKVVVPIFTLFPLSPLLVRASELSGNVQRPFGIPKGNQHKNEQCQRQWRIAGKKVCLRLYMCVKSNSFS